MLGEPAAHAGKIYTLTGPAAISLPEASRDIESALNRTIAYQPISAEQADLGSADKTGAWGTKLQLELGKQECA